MVAKLKIRTQTMKIIIETVDGGWIITLDGKKRVFGLHDLMIRWLQDALLHPAKDKP